MFTRKVNGELEYVFDNESEFRLFYPDEKLNDWKTANDGDWVLTDDMQVCRILKKSSFKSRNRQQPVGYIRTLLGMATITENSKLEGRPVRNFYSFSNKEYAEKLRDNRDKPTKNEIMFAKYVATGLDIEKAYLKAFKTKDISYAKNSSSKLIKTERIQKLITEEMKAALDKVGVDPEYLLKNSKKIIDKNNSRDSDKLRAIETLMKVAGMFPANDKKSESLTVFQGFSQEQLEQLKSSDAKAIAHAEIEHNEG
ncbi:hypothetical protein CMI47_16495 [Candidatus Pacearchaeota archaeon]|jgi:hypothetical protein|nr:hypothetical protein [Candidatus Pacearchaeota archaeon]|tara:strand:+ start:13018 stop:13779 length:762 start_codon:yes stop_codon:yes gene_type:complete